MRILYLDGPRFFDPAVSLAHSRGDEVWAVLAEGANHEGVRADRIITVKRYDPESVAEAVEGLLPADGRFVFTCFHERPVPLTCRLNDRLGSRARRPSFESAEKARNKYRMRQALQGTGLNPEFALLPVEGRAPSLPLSRSGRWVVKPLIGYSSIGVEVFDSPDLLDEVRSRNGAVLEGLASLAPGLRPEDLHLAKDHLLLEEFIDGEEYSVEVVIYDGRPVPLQVFSKTPMEEPFFEEVSYCSPGFCPPGAREKLFAAAVETCRRAGIGDGVAHIEFRRNERGVFFLDIGLRVGGSGLSHSLVEHSTGADMLGALYAVFHDEDPSPLLVPKRADTAVLYLLQVGPGGVVEGFPPPEAVRHPGFSCVRSQLFNKPGDRLSPYPAYSGLPGYHLFRSQGKQPTQADVSALIAECRRTLNPRYRSAS